MESSRRKRAGKDDWASSHNLIYGIWEGFQFLDLVICTVYTHGVRWFGMILAFLNHGMEIKEQCPLVRSLLKYVPLITPKEKEKDRWLYKRPQTPRYYTQKPKNPAV